MVEERLRKLEDSMLLVHRDIAEINKTFKVLNETFAKLTEFQIKQSSLESDYKLHKKEQIRINELVITQLETINSNIMVYNSNSEFIDNLKKLMWRVITYLVLGSMGVLGVAALYIYSGVPS